MNKFCSILVLSLQISWVNSQSSYYSKEKKLLESGTYINGELCTGQKYSYYKKGNLKKIEFYENGVLTKDSVLSKDNEIYNEKKDPLNVYPNDSIDTSGKLNQIDTLKKKQGYWIIKGKNKPTSSYPAEQKMEEGYYVDNRKTGIWKEYFKDGMLKNTLTFANGRPEGMATIFYENGNIKEEGTWKINRWTGAYRIYAEDGSFQEYTFDAKGKREGHSYIACGGYTERRDSANTSFGKMPLNGEHKLYNKRKQLTKEGEFKDGRLMDGKAYIYDEDGVLLRTLFFKNGIYVGDKEIDEHFEK